VERLPIGAAKIAYKKPRRYNAYHAVPFLLQLSLVLPGTTF